MLYELSFVYTSNLINFVVLLFCVDKDYFSCF